VIPTSRRILVVDDDAASCDLVSYFLKSLGYRVAAAPDGNRALNMGTQSDIELVIMDVHMPDYDGIEVLAMLRKRHVMRPVKVVALTADDSEDVRAALEDQGIDGFLTKPVDLEALRETVDRLMAGHSQRDLGLYGRMLDRRLRRPA
jgi:CheY-like chemotaxis protein